MKISFIIAVYRNEGALSKTYENLKSVFTTSLSEYEYEIIFVDDGSDDGSLSEMMGLRKNDSRVKVITFTRNFGQMSAMLAGFKEASGDVVLNISADLQDPIGLVPQMVQKWREGAEIVVCYRTGRSDSLTANLCSRFAYGALRLSIPQIPQGGFDFVLMDKTVLKVFNEIDVRNRFFQGDLLWLGYRTAFIPYVRRKRLIGKSQYSFTKKLKNFLDAFLDASYLPIRLISFLGVATSALGLVYGGTVVYSWFRGATPFTGWAPIMIVFLLIGGLIMVMLGVIGEYIWRIYDEVRKKPNYIIRSKYL